MTVTSQQTKKDFNFSWILAGDVFYSVKMVPSKIQYLFGSLLSVTKIYFTYIFSSENKGKEH